MGEIEPVSDAGGASLPPKDPGKVKEFVTTESGYFSFPTEGLFAATLVDVWKYDMNPMIKLIGTSNDYKKQVNGCGA